MCNPPLNNSHSASQYPGSLFLPSEQTDDLSATLPIAINSCESEFESVTHDPFIYPSLEAGDSSTRGEFNGSVCIV